MAKTRKPSEPKPKYRKKDKPASVTPVTHSAKLSAPSAGRQNAGSPLATPQQERARFALERIQTLANDTLKDQPKAQQEFNSHASAMPFMIRANGLGQTAAFYRRKGEAHLYFTLYQLLGDWLTKPNQPFEGKTDLLSAITQSDQDAYLAAQIEALLFLDWVKKLASAFLAREGDEATSHLETGS
jgi:CRISPR-associated protein Cmr5